MSEADVVEQDDNDVRRSPSCASTVNGGGTVTLCRSISVIGSRSGSGTGKTARSNSSAAAATAAVASPFDSGAPVAAKTPDRDAQSDKNYDRKSPTYVHSTSPSRNGLRFDNHYVYTTGLGDFTKRGG